MAESDRAGGKDVFFHRQRIGRQVRVALLDQTRDLIAELTPVENDLLREVHAFLK